MANAKDSGEAWGADALVWADCQEPFSLPLWEAMLDNTNVGRGTRLLDAGCGAGGACRMALGRGASVFGLDAAERSIALAKDRLPAADFRVGDLEALPYDDASFDAVIAVNSVQFANSPINVIGELTRVCNKAGTISVAVFGPEGNEENLVFEEINKVLPRVDAAPGEFNLSAPGKLEEMMTASGLRVVSTHEIGTPFIYHNVDAAWRAQQSAGSIRDAIKAASEEEVRAAAIRGFKKFLKKSGEVRIEVPMRYVTAVR